MVSHFTAEPTTPAADEAGSTAFFTTPDGSATAGQPDLMNSVYPSNDYPGDKATFSFRMDVPAGETAVANGDLTGRRTAAGRSIWTYAEKQPMATELTQLVAGDFTVVPRGRVDGIAVRDVIPTRLAGAYKKLLSVEKSQISWMEQRVGAFPFDRYGSLITDAPLGFALETQTLSLYGNALIADPEAVSAPFRGCSASTTDFIALASAISGHDQTAFLRSWLYGTTTLPMPGHPDWTVTPVS